MTRTFFAWMEPEAFDYVPRLAPEWEEGGVPTGSTEVVTTLVHDGQTHEFRACVPVRTLTNLTEDSAEALGKHIGRSIFTTLTGQRPTR